MQGEHPPALNEHGAAESHRVVEAVDSVTDWSPGGEPAGGRAAGLGAHVGGRCRAWAPWPARVSSVFGVGLLIGATLHCLAAPSSRSFDSRGSGGAGGSAGLEGCRTAPDAGSGAGGSEAQQTGWHGEVPMLHNDAACELWTYVAASAADDGHLAAVRLTPPSYPFVATEIQYELVGQQPDCDTGIAHRIELSSGWGVMPPATPSQILVVHDTPATERVRVVTKELVQPVELVAGMHLFVAVELVAGSSCIAACARVTDTGRDYVSTTVHEPHSWIPIASAHTSVHFRIGANGHAL